MCFSRENGCIESKNNLKKNKNLHFWDCNESMISFIVKKLNIKLNGEYAKQECNDENDDNINELKKDDIDNLLRHDNDDDKYDEKRDILNTGKFKDTSGAQKPNQYCTIDGQVASHGQTHEKYVYDEKTNNIVLRTMNHDKYDDNCCDNFLFTDESIELYPNKELRYGNKIHYCGGKFSSLTDDQWFEFIYQNYLHFIIKTYKSNKIKMLKDKQIFTQVVNATNVDNIQHTWRNVQKLVVKSKLKRSMAML